MNAEQPMEPVTHDDTPLGDWPQPASRIGVVFSGLVWAAWIVFLVWMMLERMNTPQ